jgi:hypothetical protein
LFNLYRIKCPDATLFHYPFFYPFVLLLPLLRVPFGYLGMPMYRSAVTDHIDGTGDFR